jgi:hypothetical protein
MTPLEKIGGTLFVLGTLVLVVVGIFVERDRAKTAAKEATKLRKIADELGVSEEHVAQIAVDRLYKQLFPEDQT